MNADAFRYLYNYHFAENRKIWNYVMALSQEDFTKPVEYSIGSVRDQVVHLADVDDVWFSDLRGQDGPTEWLEPMSSADRQQIRAGWDLVEAGMRQYLETLQDDMLSDKPLSGEDADLTVWQVLLHVINHGTDHRAQLLRLLNDLGQRTGPQDLVFHIYEHPYSAG